MFKYLYQSCCQDAQNVDLSEHIAKAEKKKLLEIEFVRVYRRTY